MQAVTGGRMVASVKKGGYSREKKKKLSDGGKNGGNDEMGTMGQQPDVGFVLSLTGNRGGGKKKKIGRKKPSKTSALKRKQTNRLVT